MCSPCGPMVCYKYEDCGPPKGKVSKESLRTDESGGKKKKEKENPLKRIKSRELRGGIMYYSCHCIKRNGLQHDCRRTGCGGEPACLVLPHPLCAPSQLARARGLADPAPFAAHMHTQGSRGPVGPADRKIGSGKRFIVCELKGVVPDVSVGKKGKCCKCPTSKVISSSSGLKGHTCICGSVNSRSKQLSVTSLSKCTCSSNSNAQPSKFAFDENVVKSILQCFENKELATDDVHGPRGRVRKNAFATEESCTRPGCLHWQPPPPCIWDAPCKADCFETPAGIQPGRNRLSGRGNQSAGKTSDKYKEVVGSQSGHQKSGTNMKLLTYECCTGCSAPRDGAGTAGGGAAAAGMPMLVMKLC